MKKLKFFIIIFSFLLILPSGLLWAQAKVGTAGAQFLELGVSPRAIGMGDAFLAVVDDASAVYYNPSALTILTAREVMFTHNDYIADIRYEFVGYAHPLRKIGGVTGVGFYILDAGEIDRTDYSYPFGSGETFSARSWALSLSYARNLTDRFSLGTTIKYITESYDDQDARGWGFDMGTNYEVGYRNARISMVLSNFGPDMKFIQESYPLPINFKVGVSMEVVSNGAHRAVVAVEGSHPADNLEKYQIGTEYWYNNMFAVRFGNQFKREKFDGGIAFGVGLKFNLGSKIKAKVDYSFRDMGTLDNDILGNPQRFSVGFSF